MKSENLSIATKQNAGEFVIPKTAIENIPYQNINGELQRIIKIGNVEYRIGKMNYGDYFLEPTKWTGGETDGFSPETIWLDRSGVGTGNLAINTKVWSFTDKEMADLKRYFEVKAL